MYSFGKGAGAAWRSFLHWWAAAVWCMSCDIRVTAPTPPPQEYTRKKIAHFLVNHTTYELIPESGKVVVLDMDLPVRQAFHALHEQVRAVK
jgi:hypothetical protein